MDYNWKLVAGMGVVLILPQSFVLPYTYFLTESRSNNDVEYNIVIIGVQLVKEMKVKYLEAYGDSNLVIN